VVAQDRSADLTRTAPCEVPIVTGRQGFQQRWARCGACGQVRPIRAGTLDDPRCAEFIRIEPGYWEHLVGMADQRDVLFGVR
jgi:hypothetical protein